MLRNRKIIKKEATDWTDLNILDNIKKHFGGAFEWAKNVYIHMN